MSRFQATAIFAGLTLPLAIASHLAAEALALHQSLLSITASPLHAYLGVAALCSLVLTVRFIASARGDLRRSAGVLASALPFHGRGARFFALAASIQFVFAAGTLAGEGSLDAGSLLVALCAVAVAAIAASALFAMLRSRLEHVARFRFNHRRPFAPRRRLTPQPLSAGPYFAFVPARGNRPPPLR